MDPFFVLGVPHDAGDEAVEARYQELLRHLPPDRFPAEFTKLRSAYEALRSERGRVETLLFYFDSEGQEVLDYPAWLARQPPRPPSRQSLRALMLENLV